jgi:hypothetical protein
VELRHAECVDGTCQFVLRIDDHCHAGNFDQRSYDCSLSDDEILAMAYPRSDAASGYCHCDDGGGQRCVCCGAASQCTEDECDGGT